MVEPPGKRKWIALAEAAAMPDVGEERLIEALIAGDIRCRFHVQGSPPKDVPLDWLARANIDWPHSRIEAKAPPFFSGPVEVNRQDLLDYFGSADPPRNRGGRPPKWDWDAFWVEVAAVVHVEGRPETQNDMVRRMQQWFVDTYGNQPSDSQVKARISKLYQRFKHI
jgi:hypothetical protein